MPVTGGSSPGAAHRGARGLVGRDELLDDLTVVARQALAGAGSIVLLTGEAGIGKTSVARAVAREVRDELTVRWGNCAADRSAPPFWPWRAVVTVGAAATHADGDTALGVRRYEHLNVLRDQVLELAPCLVVIEDLQWADVSSVLLLAHLGATATDAPIMVLGTVRSGEPIDPRLDEALEQVRRLAEVRRVPPLDDRALDVLVREAGLETDAEIAAVVRTRTGGNPLFATELLRAARAEGGRQPGSTLVEAGVPDRIAELIGRRLDRLPDAVADLVMAASAIGTDGDTHTLAAVAARDPLTTVELLEQAQAAKLVELPTPGRWRFGHELLRDAVYERLAEPTRGERHAAALETLATQPGTPPPVLAHHALAALPRFDAERAVALAAEAGRWAFDRCAYEEAVRWFEQALAATTPDLTHRWRAELLVLCGEARRQMGDVDEARQAFLTAADLTDDHALLARAALGYADPGADLGIAYRTEDPVTVSLLDRAIAAQASRPSPVAARLRARLAAELYFSDDPARARALIDEAIADADRSGDPRTLVTVHAVAHDAFVVGQGTLDEQRRDSAQLLDWARRSASPAALLTARRARVFDLLAAADLSAVDAEILAFRRVAEPLNVPGYAWWPALWSAMRALLAGRHDQAEERALAAYELGARPFPVLSMVNLSFLLFFLRREQGRLPEMEEATRDYAASHADIPALRVALAFLLAETGQLDEARGMLDAIAATDLERLHDRNWPASWFQLARAAYLAGDRPLARALLDDVRRPTERAVPVSLATVCLGSTDLATAWLLRTAGDPDGADERYDAAETVNARLGARSWLAQARADHAVLLLERDRPGDGERADRLVELATRAAADIGLAPVARTLDGLDPVGAGAAPPADVEATAGVSGAATFRRIGSVWELDFAGRRAQIPHTRGMADLAELLSRPDRAVSVLELLGDAAASSAARGAPTLDDRALQEIRRHLHDLDDEVAEAEAHHDDERAAAARAERQQLAEAVTRDLGLGGRARRVDDPVERARKTVSTRIRRAIAAVERTHPELGRHLERSIDTGAWCAYRPAEPQRWTT